MTRREIERVAEAVKKVQTDENAATISLAIGRAVLGDGAGVEAWAKWLKATGWPPAIIPEVARQRVFGARR